jgi:hypothetical protein
VGSLHHPQRAAAGMRMQVATMHQAQCSVGQGGTQVGTEGPAQHASLANASWVKNEIPLSLVPLSLPAPTQKPKQCTVPASFAPAAPSQLSRGRTARRSVARSQLPPRKPLAKRAVRHQLRGCGGKRWSSLSAGTSWSLTEPSLSKNLSAACVCSQPASLEATAAC